MIKVVWLLIVIHYNPAEDYVSWSETQFHQTKETCELDAAEQTARLKQDGIQPHHMMTECIQRVVPSK
jgi:hypothetical protein